MGMPHCSVESLERRSLLSTVVPGSEFEVGGAGDYWGTYGRTVASDANGNFVVAVSDGAFENDDVHVRLFDSAGVPKTGWILADTPNDVWTKFAPNVAMAGNGNFVVTWWQTSNFVGARLFNAAGQPIGPIITVQKAASTSQSHPTAAMDDAGNFVVVWNAIQGGQSDEVFAQRYNAAGVAQGKRLAVNTYSARGQGGASVDMDADGDFLVAWTSQAQDGSSDGVYGQRFRRDGARQGGEFRVNTTTAGGQGGPSVALDAVGDAVVVWQGPAADGTGGVWGQRYTPAGAPAGGEVRINGSAAGEVVGPAVDMDRAGAFVATWSQYVLGSGSSTNWGQAYGPGATPVGGNFVFSSTRNPSYSQVAMQPGNAFVVIGARDDLGGGLFGQTYIVL